LFSKPSPLSNLYFSPSSSSPPYSLYIYPPDTLVGVIIHAPFPTTTTYDFIVPSVLPLIPSPLSIYSFSPVMAWLTKLFGQDGRCIAQGGEHTSRCKSMWCYHKFSPPSRCNALHHKGQMECIST
jgi:hypothetical protein